MGTRVEPRDALQQAERVRVPGAREQLLRRARFDQRACVHDVYPIAHARDDAEVVRDQDQRRVPLPDRLSQGSRIWAWIVTSRAVVGSSAMSSFGSHESAMAIIARWRIPPENWCG